MKRALILFFALGLLALGVGHVGAQTAVPASVPVRVRLHAGEKQSFEIHAQPGALVLFQLDLEGGLVAVQSTQAARRLLDLGSTGRVLFAVTCSVEGLGRIELSSAEQSRLGVVAVQDVTNAYPEEDREHLLAAGIDFARADMARRHMPGAPDIQTALSLYEAATTEAQAAHDVSLARWVMTQKARFLIYQRSNFVEARALLSRAVALPDDKDDAVQALAFKTLGADAYFLGDLPGATNAAEKALSLYRKTGDLYWQGVVLSNLISQYGEAGREEDAVAAGQEALADSEKTEDPAGVVFTLTELGTLYREHGNYEDAFQTYRRAIVWGQSIHYAPLIEAEIEKDLGRLYLDLGLWTEAEEQLHLCLSHASPDSQAALDARGMLARVLVENGRTREALHEYDSAIAIAKKLELKPEEVSLMLRRSSALLQVGQIRAAQTDIAQTAQLTDQLKIPALSLERTLTEGEVEEYTCASCPETKQTYERALTLSREIGSREQEASADAGLARVYAAQRNDEAALKAVAEALAIVEYSRSSLATQDLAATYFTGRRTWYDLAIELSMRLDRRAPSKGFSELAFRYAERSKARTMLDAMGEERPSETESLPDNLRQRIWANRLQIEKEKAILLASTNPKSTATALRSLYTEKDALTAEIRTQSGRSSRIRDNWTASAKDVQQSLLHPDEALLAFSQGERRSYRWLMTQSSFAVAALPAKQILQRSLEPLQQMLLNRQPQLSPGENAQQYQARLSQWNTSRDEALLSAGHLLLPALPRNIHHLYIVADGSLLSIPWGALRQRCGGRICYALEQYAFSVEPSASVAVSLVRSAHRSTSQNVLVVADTIATQLRETPRWISFSPLPGTRREADSIAKLVPAAHLRQLRGEKATADNVRSALRSDLSVLHLSTHTLLVSGHPELSGIALSSGSLRNGETQNVLWLRDIPSLHAPSLVTLSGCTTQGRSLSGEELTTLTQAFFYAGSDQVIGSIWNVDDEATATLMADFYRRLFKDKLSVAEAMRQTQLNMLNNHTPLPDWAGFVVNGVQPAAIQRRQSEIR